MKKLIAIFTVAALVLSLGLCAFADELPDIETVYEDGMFTTTVRRNVGSQVTLIMYKGNELKLTDGGNTDGTNIEFIDQKTYPNGDTVFEYKPRGEALTPGTYTIKVGGSNITNVNDLLTDTYVYGTASDGISISGTVENLLPAMGEPYDEIWGTYVTLRTSAYGDLVEGTEPIMITPPEEYGSRRFVISDVKPGIYIVQIEKLGYLPRCMKVEVSNADIDLDEEFLSTDLLAGEIVIDGSIYGDDTDTILNILGSSMGDGEYREDCDLVVDGSIYGDDFDLAIMNIGISVDSAYIGAEDAF